jgi:hypothetical protein
MLALVALSVGVPPACDVQNASVCDSFCTGGCGFYNTSLKERGMPQNLTVYRITPKNVSGLANKNTADPPGDLTFVISRKNLTQQCLHDPSGRGCHTDLESVALYGQFLIEVDGQWGPYLMCNPVDGWDTSDWRCGQECLEPTSAGCNPPFYGKHNGTGPLGAQECWCDSSLRQQHTVGREGPPGQQPSAIQKRGYVPQCASYELWEAFFVASPCGEPDASAGGQVYATVSGWSFESVSSLACQKCEMDAQCTGWSSVDNVTAQLFTGATKVANTPGCVGAKKSTHHHHHHGGGPSWYGVANLGDGYSSNIWYSTPAEGQCAEGEPLGTNGCTWRLVSTLKYANATCVDEKADAAVEAHGKVCFDTCPKPLDRNTDCYLDCYRNTLMGDASQNLTRVPTEKIVQPWVNAFTSSDPKQGGCPHVKPSSGPFELEKGRASSLPLLLTAAPFF